MAWKIGFGDAVTDVDPLQLDFANATITANSNGSYQLRFPLVTSSGFISGTLDGITINTGGQITIPADSFEFEMHSWTPGEIQRNLVTLGALVFVMGPGMSYNVQFRSGVTLPSAILNQFRAATPFTP